MSIISIPKLCECEDTNQPFTPTEIPSVCTPCETEDTTFTPVALPTSTLCPCPVEPDLLIRPVRTVQTLDKNCYANLIGEMTSKKYCDVGPKCR